MAHCLLHNLTNTIMPHFAFHQRLSQNPMPPLLKKKKNPNKVHWLTHKTTFKSLRNTVRFYHFHCGLLKTQQATLIRLLYFQSGHINNIKSKL